jgi:pimeloyl-ACP methyl ester carboxylesterase
MSSRAPALRARQLDTLGLRTRVLESGPESGDEAVVFVHGGPGSADDWRELLPRVGAFARAVAFDLPGFGGADKPADWAYSPNEWGTFIAGALSELGIRRVHVVGNDLGGNVGLAWGAAHPGSFASAVMINAGTLVGCRWHWLARMHRTALVGLILARTGRVGLRTIMRVYEPKLPKQVVDRWLDGFGWGTRRALLRFYRSLPSSAFGRIAPDLARLDRPALVLWGARDRFVPAEQAERERECFPSAQVRLLEGSGHYPQLDDPGAVADAVVPFLRGQLA